MKRIIFSLLVCIVIISCKHSEKKIPNKRNQVTHIKLCVENNQITKDWRNALTRRKSVAYLDSLEQVVKPLSISENAWLNLIKSKENSWNQMKDSLKIPFGDIYINDTTYVYLGYQGNDDGFTYKYQTVCFDLTALNRAYGSAKDSVNDNRIDRIFTHEYTHVLHKEWARQKKLVLKTFQDSILWECMYEGIGMYRSMSVKWRPIGDSLSPTASKNFENLYPTFVERLTTIETSKELSFNDKKRLHKNLSRGSMKQKWGALPMGVWLALEAKGNPENLKTWIDKGPNAVIPLALKHLSGEHKIKFEKVFMNQFSH